MVFRELAEQVVGWMANPANNCIEPGSSLPAFGEPLIGVAEGGDELFSFIKHDIGPDFYWTPQEAFAVAYPEVEAAAGELSVIAWVLPQTESTRAAHRRENEFPSIEWSKARLYGEQVNERLRSYIVEWFRSQGIFACAPILLPEWSRATSEKYGFASKWSERHSAHVCGLGTFGLSDGLITPVGKSVRVGSVIAQKRFPPTPRTYTSHTEYCIFAAKGKCLACVRRCPVGAISEKGHDKVKCKAYIRNVTGVYVEQHQLGVRVSSCGLCQTKVPCEKGIPKALGKRVGLDD